MHPPLLALQDLLDRRLGDEARLAATEHVAACEHCRRRLHALRWTRVRLAGAAAGLGMPGALQAELRRIVHSPNPRPEPEPSPEPGWRGWLTGWKKKRK